MWRCNVTAWRHVTLWRRGVTSYDILCHGREIVQSRNHLKLRNSPFCNLVTLTFDLGLRTHPRYYQDQCLHQILELYAKRFSRESVHRHTDRRDRFHILDGWRGREWSVLSVMLFIMISAYKFIYCEDRRIALKYTCRVPTSLNILMYSFSYMPHIKTFRNVSNLETYVVCVSSAARST